jgi:hypothetical protein
MTWDNSKRYFDEKVNTGIVVSGLFLITTLFASIYELCFIIGLKSNYLKTTKGEIIDKYYTTSRSLKYKVKFIVGGKEYTTINRQAMDSRFVLEDAIPVIYNPNDPQSAEINLYSQTYRPFINCFSLFFFSSCCLNFLLWYRRKHEIPLPWEKQV